ncbi:MAG: GNAT family N-acetyltransferase [Candidatus Cloacimonetes bacterium]|nr:GNAT family N-acetyltransferase [Candidatus Cloacimonadota bacterium]
MGITQRQYKLLGDFNKVLDYLTDVYNIETLNSYLLPQFFEYAHTHPLFNHKLTHRFGIWENNNDIVGLACYEMDIGECFVSIKKGYEALLPEMIKYSEENMSFDNKISFWIIDKEIEKKELLEKMSYKRIHAEPVTIFQYDQPFPEKRLPKGFSVITLEDENDFRKINDCLWYGFDHGPEPDPDQDIDCRMLMQSGPNFRKDLTTIIKAPNGEYACFAGMWIDTVNNYAYLEPLATVPEYRGLGLATVAVVEGMKKTKALGAKYCFGGVSDFYQYLGFKTISHRELWKKICINGI